MWPRFVVLLLLLLLPACSGNSGGAGAPSSDIATSGGATGGDVPASAPAQVPAGTGEGGAVAAKGPMPPAEAWTAIRSGGLLVDVRTQAEYDQGHLEEALLIPHDQIGARAGELGDDKSRPIVLYCRSGNRSSQAKAALESLGFTNVMNAGGYETLNRAR
jgi:phage shock protein E